MYPFIQEALMAEGEIFAIPWEYSLYIYGYNPTLWAEVGFTKEQVPTTYQEYLQLWLQWEKVKEGYPHLQLHRETPDLWSLLMGMMDTYMKDYQQKGEQVVFDTPLFRELMALVNQIPFDQSPPNSFTEENALIGSYIFQNHGMSLMEPMPLAITKGGLVKTFNQLSFSIMYINAYTQNPQGALAYLETTLKKPPFPFFILPKPLP